MGSLDSDQFVPFHFVRIQKLLKRRDSIGKQIGIIWTEQCGNFTRSGKRRNYLQVLCLRFVCQNKLKQL